MKLEPVAWALAYDGKLQTETIYTDHKTALRHAAIENERWEDVDWSVVDFYPPIPAGYVLVPVESTPAMNFAGYDECNRVSTVQVGLATIAAIYKAMIEGEQ